MSSLPTLETGINKVKSFWERPEGTTGMIMIALTLLGGALLLPTILSVLTMAVAVVGKAITLTIMGAVLAVLLMIVTNRRVWTLVNYGFRSVMRSLTGWFVEIDPIGIMKSYVEDITDKLILMDKRISDLNGQIKICEQNMKNNKTEGDRSLGIAQQAQRAGNSTALALHSRVVGRMTKSNVTLGELLMRMQFLYRALKKYREAAGVVVEDLKSEIKVKQMERETILASYSAMKAAEDIMRGGGDKAELFNQAMEYVADDYGKKLGEIEDFMSSSQGFLDTIDLENASYETAALQKLQEWEQKADSLLLGDGKRQLLEYAGTNLAPQLNVEPTTITLKQGAGYDKYFDAPAR